MALIQCPECQKEISDKAPSCIHCGFPLSSSIKLPKEASTDSESQYSYKNTTPVGAFETGNNAASNARTRALRDWKNQEQTTQIDDDTTSKSLGLWWKIPIGLIFIFFAMALCSKPDPRSDAMAQKRRAIESCEQTANDVLLDLDARRLARDTCKKMKEDFIKEYNVDP